MTDHWKDVQPVYPFSESPHRDDGPACYFADSVDAARAKDAAAHAAALAEKDAEIARLRAQVDEDAHLRSVVELYRSDPMAMADAIVRLREDVGALRAEKD